MSIYIICEGCDERIRAVTLEERAQGMRYINGSHVLLNDTEWLIDVHNAECLARWATKVGA